MQLFCSVLHVTLRLLVVAFSWASGIQNPCSLYVKSLGIFVSYRPVVANGFETLKPLISYRFSAVPVKDADGSKSSGCHP